MNLNCKVLYTGFLLFITRILLCPPFIDNWFHFHGTYVKLSLFIIVTYNFLNAFLHNFWITTIWMVFYTTFLFPMYTLVAELGIIIAVPYDVTILYHYSQITTTDIKIYVYFNPRSLLMNVKTARFTENVCYLLHD